MNVAIVGSDPDACQSLATEFRARDIGAVTVAPTDGRPHDLACDTASAEQVQLCLERAESVLGAQPALIRLGISPAQAAAGELAELRLADWVARAEAPMREALAFHQAAQRFLGERSGRIVVVIPTVGLSGGPGHVPLASTAEADRSLVKAQARVSGGRDVTINCLAVASAALVGSDVDPDRSGLPAQALAAPAMAQVADAIAALLGSAFDGVTGQTIALDGGRWMAP